MSYWHSYAPPGQMLYVGQATGHPTSTTSANFADQELTVLPVVSPYEMTVSKIQFEITAGGVGNWRVVVYDSLPSDGYPDALLYESADVDISSSGIKSVSPPSLTFEAERLYWVGVWASTSSSPTIRRRSGYEGSLTLWGFEDSDRVQHSTGAGIPEAGLHLSGQASVPDPFPASAGSAGLQDTPVMTIEYA